MNTQRLTLTYYDWIHRWREVLPRWPKGPTRQKGQGADQAQSSREPRRPKITVTARVTIRACDQDVQRKSAQRLGCLANLLYDLGKRLITNSDSGAQEL
jgi:hypothetical protein